MTDCKQLCADLVAWAEKTSAHYYSEPGVLTEPEPPSLKELVERARTALAKPEPEGPSLKEQAKFAAAVLRSPDETCSIAELQQHWHTICNALEALPE